ncbi:hypothetical protein D3C81_1374070 [compost metagenome]
MQLLEVLGWNRAQAEIDQFRQLRQVAAGGDPQQLRIADVGKYGEAGEFGVTAETGELRLVDHRVAGLSAEQPVQRHPVAVDHLQFQPGIGAAQVVEYRTGTAHRHRIGRTQLLQLDGAALATLAHQQARHPQIRIGEQPSAQGDGRLGNARSEIHRAFADRLVQRGLILEHAPHEVDP